MFLARLTLHTKGLPTHDMMAACLRDILIYSRPHISLPVSHPNTIHHSRLDACLIDYLDLNPCLSIVFWLSVWFLRLRFCRRCRNIESRIAITTPKLLNDSFSFIHSY